MLHRGFLLSVFFIFILYEKYDYQGPTENPLFNVISFVRHELNLKRHIFTCRIENPSSIDYN